MSQDYIHIFGWQTEQAFNVDNNIDTAKHIDSVAQHDDWQSAVAEIVSDSLDSYFYITVEDENGNIVSDSDSYHTKSVISGC
jgi:hypothetical protein